MKTSILFALLASALLATAASAEPPATQSVPKAAPAIAPHNHMTEKIGVPAPAKQGPAPDKDGLQRRHIHSRDAK